MSISIYSPYFYIIQHINSGKYYAGVKYAENANPDQFLKFNGYQTSSTIIKQIILEEGLDSFVIRKIKVFETGEEALDYESRFLRRVNAAFNDNFLNRSNNSISTLNVDWEKRKQGNVEKYGYEYAMQSEFIKNKGKQTNLEKYGCENVFQNEDIKYKSKQTMVEKYGYEYPSQVPEFLEKQKQTNLEKYGFSYITQTPEFQEKSKQTMLERYGVSNISQSPEIKEKKKEKKRQTRLFLSNQPIALEIIKYKDKYGLKLGSYWMYKSQEFLDNLLTELNMTYGDMALGNIYEK